MMADNRNTRNHGVQKITDIWYSAFNHDGKTVRVHLHLYQGIGWIEQVADRWIFKQSESGFRTCFLMFNERGF